MKRRSLTVPHLLTSAGLLRQGAAAARLLTSAGLVLGLAGLVAVGCAPRGESARAPGVPSYDPKEGLPGAVRPYFTLDLADPTATFFDQPWPSELRRRPDGLPDLTKFPGRSTFFERHIELAETTLRGASVSPTLYVRLSGPVDLPASGVSPALVLMDVDPKSPEVGKKWTTVARRAGETGRHVPPGTLQVRVAPGFVLRPGTLYALVVLRTLATPPLGTTLAFEATKATVARSDGREEAARGALRPVYEALESHGIGRASVASVAAFRTQDPTELTRALLAHAGALQGERVPRLLRAGWDPGLSRPSDAAPYFVIRGAYCTPSYQQDTARAPYLQSGGAILRDGRGEPLLAPLAPGHPSFRPECGPLLPARFVLTIPAAAPPPEGYPLVISAHGTGGDALSFLGADDFAGWAARQGIAVVSTDQPLHGAGGEAPRPGSNPRALALPSVFGMRLPFELDPAMLFYNPLNPAASRGNLHQATVDAATLLRLLAGLDLGAVAGLRGADGSPAPVRFRADRLLLAGHSQGSQSLSVLGALDPRVRGVVLSGCGGDTRYGVLANKEFARFRPIAEGMLGMAPGELDEFHPFLALVQALSDPIDPQSYAWLYHAPGLPPRSVLHVEGLGDSYTPNISAEALAVALAATPLAPLLQPPRGLDLLGLKPAPEVIGNARGGQATIALVQMAPTHREDGHFVIYREPAGGPMIGAFFAEVAAGQLPRVRWPGR